ncbi:hypothetical protein ACSBR1_012427 [Camellia fascicularis]
MLPNYLRHVKQYGASLLIKLCGLQVVRLIGGLKLDLFNIGAMISKVHHKAEQKTIREPHLRIWILDLDFLFYLNPLTRHRLLAYATDNIIKVLQGERIGTLFHRGAH